MGDDVTIVEDAAHALGALTEAAGRRLRHADMAVFSLHPVKAITTGEGGIVTTRTPELADRLRLFRSHGLTKDPELLETRRRAGGAWSSKCSASTTA